MAPVPPSPGPRTEARDVRVAAEELLDGPAERPGPLAVDHADRVVAGEDGVVQEFLHGRPGLVGRPPEQVELAGRAAPDPDRHGGRARVAAAGRRPAGAAPVPGTASSSLRETRTVRRPAWTVTISASSATTRPRSPRVRSRTSPAASASASSGTAGGGLSSASALRSRW